MSDELIRELPAVPLRRHARLLPTGDGFVDAPMKVSVGPSGEAVALWAGRAYWEAQHSMVDRSGAPPVAARITVHEPKPTAVVSITARLQAVAGPQPLPGGRFLLVGRRCRSTPQGLERNAVAYGWDGSVVGEASFGDGVAQVLTTPSGRAWAGHIDPGTPGSGAEPLGAHGLIRFAPDGSPDWRFPVAGGCLALNVDGETARACRDWGDPLVKVTGGAVRGDPLVDVTDGVVRRGPLVDVTGGVVRGDPLVDVADGAVTVWHGAALLGVTSLIADDRRVALLSGHRRQGDLLTTADLGDGDLHETGRHRLAMPAGDRLPASARIIGRGPDLHVFHRNDWYRIGLDDIRP